ncbi:hypothetical protein GR268_46830, partial [Rhizobium leguminosarum]|nr:hypothetical protein [Rhizobium leguminosarum]
FSDRAADVASGVIATGAGGGCGLEAANRARVEADRVTLSAGTCPEMMSRICCSTPEISFSTA